jgi:ABC-type branched-subunit amino acid transport system substrate-binding protein
MNAGRPSSLLPLTKGLLFLLAVIVVGAFIGLLIQLQVISGPLPVIILVIVGVPITFMTAGQCFQYHKDFPQAMSQILGIMLIPVSWIFTNLHQIGKLIQKKPKLLLIISGVLVAGLVLACLLQLFKPSPTPVSIPKLIFSFATPNGPIGISDGSYAFDVQTRNSSGLQGYADGQIKLQAAEAFRETNYPVAKYLWNRATAASESPDSNDAEALIYLENLWVIQSNKPHITFIIVTQLTGSHQEYNIGRDDLQGAYVAQKEFNDDSASPFLVRLLIANIGDREEYAQMVAERIQSQYKQDSTIKGIIGWPERTNGINQMIEKICEANIPLVTVSANDAVDQNFCAYNFSVAPSIDAQVKTAVDYIKYVLKKKRVSIIYDPANSYSKKLYDLFRSKFPDQFADTVIVDAESYSVYNGASLPGLVRATLRGEPDLIYFAGYPADLNTVLQALPDSGDIDVMGTNVLYQVSHYPPGTLQANHGNLYFTASAYPDEWSSLHQQPQPSFTQDYANDFDPSDFHPGIYSYTRANDEAMIAYDATQTLIRASASLKNTDFTMEKLQAALESTSFNGITGLIQFDSNNNAIKKPVVVIQLDNQNHNQYRYIEGCYAQGVCYGT